MNKLLISTALTTLLAAGGTALAQGHRDDHGGPPPGPAPAAHAEAPHAEAPHGGGGPRAGHDDHRAGPPPAAAAPRAAPPGGSRPDDRRFNGSPGAAGHTPDNRGPDTRGNAGARFNGPTNGPGRNAEPRQNFSAFNRNFSAPRRFRAPSYRRPSGWYAHRWAYGEILPSFFWAPDYWISDYDDYALAPPPPGTVWVRDGDDALLIDRYSGEIIQVEYGVFY